MALQRKTEGSSRYEEIAASVSWNCARHTLSYYMNSLAERLDIEVFNWAGLDPLQSFLHRNDIKEGIHGLLQDVNAVTLKHNVTIPLGFFHECINTLLQVPNLWRLGSADSLERDHAEIRGLLHVLVSNMTDMQSLLSIQSGDRLPLDEVMETLQRELYDPQLNESFRGSFTKALWFLHEQADKLPPLTDLTGQVEIDVIDRSLSGNMYSGEWLGAEKRFEAEVEKLRHLKHSNVVSLYGIIYSGRDLFTVQPWMNNGAAVDFVERNPDVDRLKILSEIASGLEYLHKENIIHGDMRGANILIDMDGAAALSGFGIASFIERHGNGIISSETVNPRWSAPELVRNLGSTSKQSDIWSFAMVVLELMTGQPPFGNIPRDITVLRELDQGKIPDCPGRVATARGLSDELWAFMRKCWHKKPDSRPSAAVVNSRLLQLRGLGLPSPKQRNFFRRPSTGNGTNSNPSGGYFTLSVPSPRSTSPLPVESDPHSSMRNIGHRRPSSTGAVVHEGGASRSLSFHSDRSESQVKIELHLGKLSLPADDRLTPTRLSDTDSDIQSPASGSSRLSLPDSSMLPQDLAIDATNVEELVDKLLSPGRQLLASFPFSTHRSAFQETILCTCRDFTTPETLLSIIIQRFHESPALQPSVFVLLTFWLSSNRLHIHPRILSQIKQFCLAVIPAETTCLNEKARNLFCLAEERASVNNTPPVSPSSLSSTKIPRTADILPRDLAIALTMLEGDNYWSILPDDYLSHLRKMEGPNNVDAASNENNKVVLWVKKSVLTPSRVETRAEVLKFFVNTAHECRKLRNFASLSAITNALQSTPIERLTLTVGALSPHLQEMLQELKSLLDPSNNHLTYRAALKPGEALDSKYRDFCIPWLAVHLRDLNSLLQNYPPTVEIQGRSLINIRRYSKFMQHVRMLRLFEPPDLERYRQNGQLAYLQHQLRGVHFDADSDVALMQRSLELEADETRIHRCANCGWAASLQTNGISRTRALELKRLGFRSS
ncbi:ras guanine nucleotide exchange factor domain-containing protein [Mycena capillaripes]|nr:ras guanine nucleotide exchange factor domain-containing protein [Mycena capillaripes]